MKRKKLQGWTSLARLSALSFMLQCFFAFGLYAHSPEQTVSGTVTSSEGNEPLPGVSVIIKGTSTGTTTDANGKYSINADKGQILTFSFVGFESYEVTVGEATVYNVSLAPDTKLLGEVIVTGYSAQSKKSITGAVSSISAKDLPNVSQASVERALQGKVPGVYISSEGSPGGSTMVRIRGFGTVNNNDPLYVIDGVPTKGNLSSLSPADIESIVVLKDASSASIYGSRASNGVVLVTTKKGTMKDGGLNVTLNRGIQSVNANRFPSLMTPQQLADANRLRQVNNSGTFNHQAYGTDPTRATLPDFINPIGFQQGDNIVNYNGEIIANVNQYEANDDDDNINAPDGIFQLMRANKEGTDWFGEVFKPTDFANVNVNYSGGTEKGTFYLGTEYYSQDGVVSHTSFDRYSAKVNSVGFAKPWMRIGQNLNITYSERVGLSNQNENGVLAQLYRIPSIIPVLDVAGNYAGNQQNAIGDARNPVAELDRAQDNKERVIRTFGNAHLEIDPIKNLTAKSQIGIDYFATNITTYNAFNYGDYQSIRNNSFSEVNMLNSSWVWFNTLNYTKDFGSHKFTALVGTEYIETVFRRAEGVRLDYISDANKDIRYLSSGTGGQSVFGGGETTALWSYFGKLDYSFNDKYLASFTMRRDGSSRFSEDIRFGYFPAASAGWVISEESFLKNNRTLNFLKLRAGYGVVGNQEIPDPLGAYTFFASDANFASYSLDGTNNVVTPGFDKQKRGNPDVTWESTTNLAIGVDAQILNSLDITLDWYQRNTTDMLVNVRQPATSGAARDAYLNVGSLENKGVELGLEYTSDRAKDFRYSIGFNISTYKNKVVQLNSSPFYGNRAFDLQMMTITKNKYPISSFYGFVIDGIFQSQEEVDAYTDVVEQDGARPGTFKYRDINNDSIINDLDRTIIGSPHPDFTYGINLNLGYKNFELSLSGTGSQGNEIFNATRFFTDFWNFSGNKSTRLLGAWTEENGSNEIPQLNSDIIIRESQESTYYIEDGSFFRLRNVQLSYNLPQSVVGKVLRSGKVYFLAQNILTLTKYSGLDPEISLQNFQDPGANRGIGVDRGAYPIPRTISLGFTATF